MLRIVTVRKVSSFNNDNASTNCNNNTIGDIMIIAMLTILMTIVLYFLQ